jgi:hypothetical protein
VTVTVRRHVRMKACDSHVRRVHIEEYVVHVIAAGAEGRQIQGAHTHSQMDECWSIVCMVRPTLLDDLSQLFGTRVRDMRAYQRAVRARI